MHGSDPEIMYLIGASLVSDWSKKKTLPMALRDLVLFPEKFEFSDEVIEPIEDDDDDDIEVWELDENFDLEIGANEEIAMALDN